ncbi:MAG: ribonuclease HI family protein [Candidatus Methanomethylophilaceae archaeon]|nr:ribonuclease HI family protein [Candidatus Methanomethylophilaceae archaeon]
MYVVYTDGGSRGNPGKSAYGVVVTSDGKIVCEASEYLGVHTNNYAEYRGLIAGISKVLELKGRKAEFVMDSQLVIRQMTGQYKVKSPDMARLHDDACALASLIPEVSFRNVRRSEELLPRADALVNRTLDLNRFFYITTRRRAAHG